MHGNGIDQSGRLFAGSVAGAALYEVDRASGAARIAVASPEGKADDIALAPDSKLIVAEVGAKRTVQIDPARGTVTEIAGNLAIGLPATPGGMTSNIPTGVGVGANYFSPDVATYMVVRKRRDDVVNVARHKSWHGCWTNTRPSSSTAPNARQRDFRLRGHSNSQRRFRHRRRGPHTQNARISTGR